MNILYLSCHSILEENELKTFHELGHNVFSLGGAYQRPDMPGDPKRPPLDIPFNQHLNDVALQCSKDHIHEELIDWADVIIAMHRLDWLENNWVKIREKKKVAVWRSIGQSVEDWERRAAHLRPEGLKIVRYSPYEERIPQYAGSDAMVRFGVKQDEYSGWNGELSQVSIYGQSILDRGRFLNFDWLNRASDGLPRALYGPGNSGISWSQGVLSFEDLRKSYRDTRVALYAGTVPASYTLSFIEMLMTGTPMVVIGRTDFGCNQIFSGQDTYEVCDIIRQGENGYIGNNPDEARSFTQHLLTSQWDAVKISSNARKTAIELFDWEKTKNGWDEFLRSI